MDSKKMKDIAKSLADRPSGRPRDDAARTAILQAALKLVKEEGYRCLTIDKISKRSGSAKTTIYRWWPSKAAVVMEAFLAYISPAIPFTPVSEQMSACDSFEKQMKAVVRAFQGPQGELLRALMAEAQFDPELQRSFLDDWIRPRREMATGILHAGVVSGELRSDLDTDVTMDALYGGLYYRLLMPYAALTPQFAKDIVRTVLGAQRT